jgi:hypothetical protein
MMEQARTAGHERKLIMTQNHQLYVGDSPAGAFVHSADADFEGVFREVGDAQAAAEDYVGHRLHWRRLDERQVLRAEVGHGKAAEIHSGPRVERYAVAVTPM